MTGHVIKGLNSDPWNVNTYIIFDQPGEAEVIARIPKDHEDKEVKGIVDINIYVDIEGIDINSAIAVRLFGGQEISNILRKFKSIFFSLGEKIELDNGQRIEIRGTENDIVEMVIYSSAFLKNKFRRVACSVKLSEKQISHVMAVLDSALISSNSIKTKGIKVWSNEKNSQLRL